MSAVTEYPVGVFCWFDLATTDADGARGFYQELLGLTATDLESDREVYTVLQKDQKSVCALYAMSQEMRVQKMPSHWLSYVSVESVDASVDNVETLGGTVMQTPIDVADAGRMAVVSDPAGAIFALWEPRRIAGAEVVGEPGTPCWSELHTDQPEGSEDFYGALLGWSTREGSGPEQPYVEFHLGDRGVGGLLKRGGDEGDAPSGWTVYFGVEDCDVVVERAKSLGGGLLGSGPVTVKGVGRFAFLRDPQGAIFAVIQRSGGG